MTDLSNLDNIDRDIIFSRLLKTRFDEVFPMSTAENENIKIVFYKEDTSRVNSSYPCFLARVKNPDFKYKGRQGRSNLSYNIRTLLKDKYPNIINNSYGLVLIAGTVGKSDYKDEVLVDVINYAVSQNPGLIQEYISNAKYANSKRSRQAKYDVGQQIIEHRRELERLKLLLSTNYWNLSKLFSTIGSHFAKQEFDQLNVKYGGTVSDVSISFQMPPHDTTYGQAIRTQIVLFNTTFANVDQDELFSFMVSSKDVEMRRFAAVVAPTKYVVPLLLDTVEVVREAAKFNKATRLYATLNKMTALELKINELQGII